MITRLDIEGFNSFLEISKRYTGLFILIQKTLDIKKAKILDVGCGEGDLTRFYAELTEEPSNITGYDIDKQRIAKAIKLNSNIKYQVKDITKPIIGKFNIITANVSLMCFDKKTKLKVVRNIENALTNNGYFIWMDTTEKADFYMPKLTQLGEFPFHIRDCALNHVFGVFYKKESIND